MGSSPTTHPINQSSDGTAAAVLIYREARGLEALILACQNQMDRHGKQFICAGAEGRARVQAPLLTPYRDAAANASASFFRRGRGTPAPLRPLYRTTWAVCTRNMNIIMNIHRNRSDILNI